MLSKADHRDHFTCRRWFKWAAICIEKNFRLFCSWLCGSIYLHFIIWWCIRHGESATVLSCIWLVCMGTLEHAKNFLGGGMWLFARWEVGIVISSTFLVFFFSCFHNIFAFAHNIMFCDLLYFYLYLCDFFIYNFCGLCLPNPV